MSSREKIFITGGLGFIGSFVSGLLIEKGHDVIIYDELVNYGVGNEKVAAYHITKRLDRVKGSKFIRGSTCDQALLRRTLHEIRPDRVIHLAAMPIVSLAITRTEEASRSIFTGTLNLLESIRDVAQLKRLVYISSSMVYGNFKQIPVPESSSTEPAEIYGALKLSGELLTSAYARLYGFEHTIVRPSSVYGMTDNHGRVISTFVENALSGKPLILKGADLSYDFTFVEDTAAGIVAAALNQNGAGRTFNISRGRSRTLFELANVVRDIFPTTHICVEHKDGRIPTRGALDITQAKEKLGYEPKVELEDGVRRYLEFIQNRVSEVGI